MDLASAAVALLVPFLGQLGGHVVGKATAELSQAAMDRLDRLYERVKVRLAGGDAAEAGRALQRLEAEPQDQRSQESFRELLGRVIERDPGFADELAALLRQAQAAAPAVTQVSDSGATAVGGGDVRITGDTAAGRDITIHQRP
jgi:hypothetical protein